MVSRIAVLSGLLIFAIPYGPVPRAAADPPTQYLVRTQSGEVRCVIHTINVACSPNTTSGFPQAPVASSVLHDNVASVDPAGAFQWAEADLPGTNPANDIILYYDHTYDLLGWTILPSSDGTRFTNDSTGHGMFVSIENVYSF
jgi:hypothetical protein